MPLLHTHSRCLDGRRTAAKEAGQGGRRALGVGTLRALLTAAGQLVQDGLVVDG